MPEDMLPEPEEAAGGLDPLVASGAVSHALRVTGLEEQQETSFLRAACEYLTGSIYRSAPFEYHVALGEDADAGFLDELSAKFEGADVTLEPVAEAVDANDTTGALLNHALSAGALEFESSGDSGKAAAVVTAEYAVSVASMTAERLVAVTLAEQENQILPRLEAFEERFAALEAAVGEAKPVDISEDLTKVLGALEDHAQRLDSNLTQDRLDTLISAVSTLAETSDGAALERLATAIETLQQSVAANARPDPVLLDPYFEQLHRQSLALMKTLDGLSGSGVELGSAPQQVSSFTTMAEAAAGEGALSAAEKLESLSEISSGLSALTHRIMVIAGLPADAAKPVFFSDADIQELAAEALRDQAGDIKLVDPEVELEEAALDQEVETLLQSSRDADAEDEAEEPQLKQA